jgi:alpha-galactosidase
VTSFQVGGYRPATVVDFEVPRRFGLRQTIGDTLGVGGIMRGLRTIPVLLDVCRDMEELCPDALLLQYVNPMAMLCWAVDRATSVRAVGLCHSVQHTAASSPPTSGSHPPSWTTTSPGSTTSPSSCAWSARARTSTRRCARHPAQREPGALRGAAPPGLLRHESSEHFAEYVPWFIKAARPDLIERFDIPLDEYPRRCEAQIAEWETLRARLRAGGAVTPSAASSTAPTSSARARPASRSPSTAT